MRGARRTAWRPVGPAAKRTGEPMSVAQIAAASSCSWCAYRVSVTRDARSVVRRPSDAIIETATASRKRNADIHCMHRWNASFGEKTARRQSEPQPIVSGNDPSAGARPAKGASADGGGSIFEWTFRRFCVKFRDFLTKAWPCLSAGPTRFGVCAPGPGQPVLRIPESDMSRPICTEHFR